VLTNNLDALLTALYVKIDDKIGGTRWLGRPPQLTDSELVTLAVAQALLGFTSESRWLRFPLFAQQEACAPRASEAISGRLSASPGSLGGSHQARTATDSFVEASKAISVDQRERPSEFTGQRMGMRHWEALAT
jgi:hypothetical protein